MADSSGFNRTGTYRTGLTFGAAGALTDSSTGVLSPGASGVAYTNQQVTNPQVYSLEVFLKTTTNGGKILGLENAQTGFGTTYDRHLYMSGGRIAYGILAGGVQQVITSTSTYNDGVFHHIVATQGASGMALYVDGALIGTNPTVAPDAANGFWRLGGGNLTGWPNAPGASALAGTYDEVAVYPTALSADRVLAHYNAASQSGTPPPAAPTNVHTTAADRDDGRPGVGRARRHDHRLQGVPQRGAPDPGARDHAGLQRNRSRQRRDLQLHRHRAECRRGVRSLDRAPGDDAGRHRHLRCRRNLQAPTVNVNQVVLTWNNSSDNVGSPDVRGATGTAS